RGSIPLVNPSLLFPRSSSVPSTLPLEQLSLLTSNAALASCRGVFPSIPASCASSCQFVGDSRSMALQPSNPSRGDILRPPSTLPRRCGLLSLMSFRQCRSSLDVRAARGRPSTSQCDGPIFPLPARFSMARSPQPIHPQLLLIYEKTSTGASTDTTPFPSCCPHAQAAPSTFVAPRKRRLHASRDIVLVSRGHP
ncbi:hypothetical protein B0H13DRAFT_2510773, partial [Mycena leptocephala]